MNFKHLSLTDFKIKIGRSARSGPVKKAFEKEQVQDKWEKTNWAKKLAMRKKRTTLNDFDRFKLKLAKQKVRFVLADHTSQIILQLQPFFLSKYDPQKSLV